MENNITTVRFYS